MKIKSENYENIKACLKEIIEIIENFKTITIDGKEFKIDSYAGGDLKWLLLFLELMLLTQNVVVHYANGIVNWLSPSTLYGL